MNVQVQSSWVHRRRYHRRSANGQSHWGAVARHTPSTCYRSKTEVNGIIVGAFTERATAIRIRCIRTISMPSPALRSPDWSMPESRLLPEPGPQIDAAPIVAFLPKCRLVAAKRDWFMVKLKSVLRHFVNGTLVGLMLVAVPSGISWTSTAPTLPTDFIAPFLALNLCRRRRTWRVSNS
jgi:hypothetical protein